jgi:lipoate-protein ligase A
VVLPSKWRLLQTPPDSGPWNMALDVALARCLELDQGVLRIYGWSHPTLSFGRNQPAKDRYGSIAVRQLDGHVVRRPTGGREVLHDRDLTYSVVLPSRALGGPRLTYRTLNATLVEAIRSLGVPARLVQSDSHSPHPDAGACFREPVRDEIEAEGRKLVGSSQARIGDVLLQHGSLPIEPASLGPEPLRSAGISLSELLSKSICFSAVAEAIETAMTGALGGLWWRGRIRVREQRVAASLLHHYESPTWTWRR